MRLFVGKSFQWAHQKNLQMGRPAYQLLAAPVNGTSDAGDFNQFLTDILKL